MASKRSRPSGWQHPTHQRAPDEARRRLGRKSKIIHVRVTEQEHEAIAAAAESAGTTNVSIYVRSVLLQAIEGFLTLPQQEVEAVPAPVTQTAAADAKSLDDWLFSQSTDAGEQPHEDIQALASAALEPEQPAPVLLMPPQGPAEPSRARIDPVVVPAPVPAPPNVPERLPGPPVVTPEIATKLDVLAQLRSIMGDDSRVGGSVRAMLDGRPKPR